MNLIQKGSKAALVFILLLASWTIKAQEDNYMPAYVSALERDLELNDDLYRIRRAAAFDHASVLSASGYAQMPADSVAEYVILLERYDTLSAGNHEKIAALKAYQKRLGIFKNAFYVSSVKYDPLAVASAVEALNIIRIESAEGAQTLDVDTLLAALAVFEEQSGIVRERFNITDLRVARRIELYRGRAMDAVLSKSLAEDFLEPWYATEQIKALSAESPVEYIRTITGRLLGLIDQMKALDESAPAGQANELLEELLAIGSEL